MKHAIRMHTVAVAMCLLGGSALASSTAALPEPLELTMRLQESSPPAQTELQVKFVGYHDTRCPSNVNCGVAGEAWAFFWVTGANVRAQVVALAWSGAEPNWRHAVRVGRYELVLRSLEPRPIQGGQVNPAEYTATLAVRNHAAPQVRAKSN